MGIGVQSELTQEQKDARERDRAKFMPDLLAYTGGDVSRANLIFDVALHASDEAQRTAFRVSQLADKQDCIAVIGLALNFLDSARRAFEMQITMAAVEDMLQGVTDEIAARSE